MLANVSTFRALCERAAPFLERNNEDGSVKMLPSQNSSESAVSELKEALMPVFGLLNSEANLAGLMKQVNTAKRDVLIRFLRWWHYQDGVAPDVRGVFVRKMQDESKNPNPMRADQAHQLLDDILALRSWAAGQLAGGLLRAAALAGGTPAAEELGQLADELRSYTGAFEASASSRRTRAQQS